MGFGERRTPSVAKNQTTNRAPQDASRQRISAALFGAFACNFCFYKKESCSHSSRRLAASQNSEAPEITQLSEARRASRWILYLQGVPQRIFFGVHIHLRGKRKRTTVAIAGVSLQKDTTLEAIGRVKPGRSSAQVVEGTAARAFGVFVHRRVCLLNRGGGGTHREIAASSL